MTLKKIINGPAPDDPTAESLWSAFNKVNENSDEVEARLISGEGDLLTSTEADKGAGMVGFRQEVEYPVNTAGAELKAIRSDLSSTSDPEKGSSLIGHNGAGPHIAGSLGEAVAAVAVPLASGSTVRRSLEDRFGEIVNVLDHGADPDGNLDSYAAFVRAHNALQPGQKFWAPPGRYAMSEKLVFSKRQVTIDVQGAIFPAEDFDDFLIDFNQDGADPEYRNLAYMLDVQRLEIDGLLQSRGVRFDQLYNSAPQNVRVYNAYGTAVAIDNSMEDSWLGLNICNGLRREAAWIGSATAWTSVATYSVGDRVYMDYGAWGAGTTYSVNGFCTYGGRSYRSLFSSNTNHQPDTSPVWWQPVPVEYFECMIANLNKDPHSTSNYTTNSGVVGDRIWKQVYGDEAALEVVNTYGDEVVDNQKFIAPMFRNNDHKTLVRIDNLANSRRVVNIEFYGPQFHQIIDAYLSAFPGTGQIAQDYSVITQVGHATRCKWFGGTTRSAENEFVTHFQLGMKNPNKLNNRNIISGMDISGEGQGNYGVSIMPGASNTAGITLTANDNEYAFTSSSTSPRICGDTTKLVSLSAAHDILNATTPGNFTASQLIRVADASGNVWYVPARSSVW